MQIGNQHEADLEMLEPAPLKKPWIATRARSQRITARQSLQLGDIAELVPARLRLVAVLSLLVCTENLNPNVVMVKFTKYRM
jgi:hypothetical protein